MLAHLLVKFVVIKLLWRSEHYLLYNILGRRGQQSGLWWAQRWWWIECLSAGPIHRNHCNGLR